jgi:hypothetical protein
MECSHCGGTVTWRGPFSALTHAECELCGAINSQKIETHEEIDDDCDEGHGFFFPPGHNPLDPESYPYQFY